MEDYFERVGDKRPDKDGIFLPTCLTETKIFEIMVDGIYGNKTNGTMATRQILSAFHNSTRFSVQNSRKLQFQR